MAMLLGKKIGMTQMYDEAANLLPVTVIQAGPCIVMQVKTVNTDGYNTVLRSPHVDKKSREQFELRTHIRVIDIHEVGYSGNLNSGKIFNKVFITEDMVGHKLGEFSPVRIFRGHSSKLKKFCKQQRMSTEQLAGQLIRGGLNRGKAVPAVQTRQKGLFKPIPRKEDIRRLATALSVEVNDLIDWCSSYRFALISARKVRLITQLVVGRRVFSGYANRLIRIAI